MEQKIRCDLNLGDNLRKLRLGRKISQEKLSEVSEIKDRFLAIYMEKCVDYLNKVDQYRSYNSGDGKK